MQSKLVIFLKVSCLFAFVGLTRCGSPSQSNLTEAWDQANQPQRLEGADHIVVLNDLPLAGSLDTHPWSDTYWPSFIGGIGRRWNDWSVLDFFTFTPPTQEALTKMSPGELAKLSPAEKYDLLMGLKHYPLLNSERKRTGGSNKEMWEGLCHGWAPAALNYKEPKAILAKNPEGLEIPFGSGDIKALLSLFQGNYSAGKTSFLGARCNKDLSTTPLASADPECRDVNAGAFHLVLANYIGIKKQGFVMDVTRDLQVWNQPVYAFSSNIEGFDPPSYHAAPGTVKEARVLTTVSYVLEAEASWHTFVGTSSNNLTDKQYRYNLELDAKGAIIGGHWLDEDRPDFLWTQDKSPFVGYFAPLGKLYEDSIAAPSAAKDPNEVDQPAQTDQTPEAPEAATSSSVTPAVATPAVATPVAAPQPTEPQ